MPIRIDRIFHRRNLSPRDEQMAQVDLPAAVPEMSTEVPKGSSSFGTFIDQNSEVFIEYADIAREFGVLEKASLETFQRIFPRIFDAYGARLRAGTIPRARTVEYQEHVFGRVFGDLPVAKALSGIGENFLVGGPSSQSVLESWKSDLERLAIPYRLAREAAAEGLASGRNILYPNLAAFLGQSYEHLTGFVEFLGDKATGRDRQFISAFLSDLWQDDIRDRAQRQDTFLDKTKKLLEKPTTENVDGSMVDKFLDHVSQQQSNLTEPEEEIRKMFKFFKLDLLRPEIQAQMIDTPMAQWPRGLREIYQAYSKREISETIGQIREMLGRNYGGQRKTGKVLTWEELQLAQRKKSVNRPIQQDPREIVVEKANDLERPQVFHAVAAIRKGTNGASYRIDTMSRHDLRAYLAKEAEKIENRGTRMRDDIAKIIHVLRQNPRAIGTSYLAGVSIYIDTRKVSMRRVDPAELVDAQGRKIKYIHPDTRDIRIVYAIAEITGIPTILIDSIQGHDEFNNKFGGSSKV